MFLDPSLCHKLSHLLGPPPPRPRRTLWTAHIALVYVTQIGLLQLHMQLYNEGQT